MVKLESESLANTLKKRFSWRVEMYFYLCNEPALKPVVCTCTEWFNVFWLLYASCLNVHKKIHKLYEDHPFSAIQWMIKKIDSKNIYW